MQGLTGRGILLLLAFVLQNSLLVLTMKYSFRSGAGRYHSSAVVTSEVSKPVTCVLVTSITRRQQTNLSTRMYLNMKKPLLVVASLLNVKATYNLLLRVICRTFLFSNVFPLVHRGIALVKHGHTVGTSNAIGETSLSQPV